MSNPDSISIVQAGLSGPVAETFREIIASEDIPFHLEAVAAARPDHVGKRLGEVCMETPEPYWDTPVISLDQAVSSTESRVVFSSLGSDAAKEYERALALGRVLATNASPLRMDSDVALVNAYVNPDQIDELFGMARPGYIVANGNCTSIIMCVALTPFFREIGIDEVEVKTLQGWSGAGRDCVPEDKVGIVEPILGDERDKIETEITKFFGTMDTRASLSTTATPQRGPWVLGHYEDIHLRLDRAATSDELINLWRRFNVSRQLAKYNFLSKPPIIDTTAPLISSGKSGVPHLSGLYPMSVMTGLVGVDEADTTKVHIEVAGDNLQLGAAGSSVMNLLLAKEKEYIP